jgi:D-lactate dehydrogenase
MGASVLGGICNNSGGALTRRGPAFTELALYGRVTHLGELELVNHLGIELGTEPEEMLRRLELGMFNPADIDHDSHRTASCQDYGSHVRDVSSPIPARFNADPRCLSEASGSAGKLVLFAARLDTFPLEKETTTFYIGSNDPAELGALRRSILTDLEQLPIAGEYLHRDMFDIAERYGKDTFLAIQHLGAGRLPMLFKLRRSIDNLAEALGLGWLKFSDRLMQALGSLFPRHLPGRLYEYRDRFEHHLLLKVSSADASPAHALLEKFYPSATGDFFECTHEEQCKAFTHRFAAAGAAVRYRAVHRDRVEEIVALDIALPRNCSDWFERLPPEIDEAISHKLYYGHFLCHVFHQDYLVKKGRNPVALEHKMWAFLDERGAEYPAEHNVGHLYKAKPALVAFYRSIDPRNQLNPGIGQTTKRRFWGEAPHSTVLSYSSRAAPPA